MSIYSESKLLMLPFGKKAGKLYSIKPVVRPGDPGYPESPGDFTVSRAANTTTRVNKNGFIEPVVANVPRIDYRNAAPVLLVEAQATNLIPYSEDFANAYWTKSGASIDDNNGAGYECPMVDAGGNNTLGAVKLVESPAGSGNTSHYLLSLSFIFINGNSYSLSLFGKADNDRGLQLNVTGVCFLGNFNLVTGEVNSAGGNTSYFANLTQSVEIYEGGYFKIKATFDCIQNVNTAIRIILLPSANYSTLTIPSYVGDGVSGAYIFGAQLETGHGSSYIPTNASTETRNADVIQVALPDGVTLVTLSDKDDVQSQGNVADPYVIPPGEWKYITMK